MAKWRRMFLCLGLAVTLGVLPSSAAAQDSKDKKKERPRGDVSAGIGQLAPEVAEKLKLTDEQKAKVAQLQKDFKQQHQQDLDKLRDVMSQVREAMTKAGTDKDRDAMRRAFQDLRAQGQTIHKLREEFDTKLAGVLRDEQKKQYEELKKERSPFARFRDRRSGGRPNSDSRPGVSGLLPRELQNDLSAEQKEKLAKLQQEVEGKVLSILTDAQKKRYEELKKERTPRGRDRQRPPAEPETKPAEKKGESKKQP
jgi:Spy/CpxP family protein refolding chaperone